jgi:hypothetical protein
LWKRSPWTIVKTGNGRFRVDNGMQSDYPILDRSGNTRWDNFYKPPKDIKSKVKTILMKRER